MKEHIDQKATEIKNNLQEVFHGLNEIVAKINNDDLALTAGEVSRSIHEPFMFVIVGEVKAGKSSFINALLGSDKEICKVAPSPMTDTIQQITYGEDRVEIINPFLKKIYQPVEILKDISIVDTPGTNTIVDHHQEITERFIPSSDLIVFVFEAKNPYRQSSWEFFDYINTDWHKKVIFVLQQKDLLPIEDLTININGVKAQAEKKGIAEPKVFAVSAKQELEHDTENSGFIELRKYLEENITGGQTPFLKLLSSINSGQQILARISAGIQDRKKQYELDKEFRKEIRETLDNQEDKSIKQVDSLVENLLNAYDRVTLTKLNELSDGLSILPMFKRSFSSMIGSTKSVKDWLAELQADLEKNLNKHLKDKLQDGVVDIADSIQNMAKIVDLKIKSSTTVLRDNHEIFSDIAERRANVLKDLQETFSSFLSRSENYYDDQIMGNSNMTPNLAAGGGIAVVGVILTAVTNIAVFDITGGILAATGIIFAGFSLGLKKKKIVKSVKTEIDEGRTRINEEISEKLEAYIGRIKTKIDENFEKFDQLLVKEGVALESLIAKEKDLENKMSTYKTEIEEYLKTVV
ncbi:dynamin family protein [Portibacter lacus]|uniref:Dynamin n=1 Tax=Portibacter lacus TaxID=1099794 RepID=A0AA37SK75_9BACT|nr:dynamin family protein [Portibacter lacus]GLR15452.1 dynamin [Portibacter lacus]